MDDKTEVQVEKKSLAGDVLELGKYRFQSYKDDKVHVHDDDNGLVFEYVGKRRFQVAVDEFIKTHFMHPVGTKVIIRGEKKDNKSADIVLIMTENGWNLVLELIGSSNGVIIADKTITFLGDFVDSL